MTDTFDLVLKNGTVFTPGGEISADIGVSGGKIMKIGSIAAEQAGVQPPEALGLGLRASTRGLVAEGGGGPEGIPCPSWDERRHILLPALGVDLFGMAQIYIDPPYRHVDHL